MTEDGIVNDTYSDDTSVLDGWNYTLFSLESIINIVFVLVVNVLFYVCVSQKNLNANFRMALFLAALGHLVGAIHRLILVGARICCIAKLDTPLVHDLILVQTTGMYLSLFGWLFAITERAIASVFTETYEPKCTGYMVPSALCVAVMLMSAVSACTSWFQLIENFDIYTLAIQIACVAVCLVALIAIVLYNKAAYRDRHNSMIQLTNRYQLDENIRGSKYLIPVAVNNVLSKVGFIMLMAYSIYFTDIPLGHDTSHLSHAYDLLFAYERIFFVLVLTIRSQKFDHFMKRQNRITTAINSETVAASNYFTDLKALWS